MDPKPPVTPFNSPQDTTPLVAPPVLDPLPLDHEPFDMLDEPVAPCWCCMWRSCLFGGFDKNQQPLATRSLDCVTQLLFWCSGMYLPGGHFRRHRWDAMTRMNETAARCDQRTGVTSKDFDLVTATHTIPIRIYEPPPADAAQHKLLQGGKVPVMLFTHGGGFCLGSRAMAQMDYLCNNFAQLGMVVVSVSYRLAPEHKFPAGIQDSYQVLRWIHDASRSAAVLPASTDRSRIVLCGDSAGGNFACVLASLARDGVTAELTSDAPYIPIAHVLLIYPALFVPVEQMHLPPEALQEKVAFIPTPVRTWFGESYVEGGAKAIAGLACTDRRLSPLVAGLHGFPPTTVVSAGLDVLRHENKYLVQELSKAGVPCAYRHFEKVPHGFCTFDFLPQARQAFAAMARDLQHVLVPGADFASELALGSMAVTPYGTGVVEHVSPNAVKVGLEWGLPAGASAKALVSVQALQGAVHRAAQRHAVGALVKVGGFGRGVVNAFRAQDNVYEVDLGWAKAFAVGGSVMVI